MQRTESAVRDADKSLLRHRWTRSVIVRTSPRPTAAAGF